jgi:hypothetical protein
MTYQARLQNDSQRALAVAQFARREHVSTMLGNDGKIYHTVTQAGGRHTVAILSVEQAMAAIADLQACLDILVR